MTFAHAVDAATVAADTTLTQLGVHHAQPIGVDRVVYDPSTNTVYAHPSSQLASDATYLLKVKGAGVPGASTTFTTESATIGLLNMRAQLDSGLAYALAGIAPGARGLHIDANVPAAGTTLTYTQDEGSVGGLVTVPVPITSATAASRYVFGSFLAPSWLNADSVIPQIPTRLFGPYVRGQARLPFVLIVPAGTAPSGGWPVAIFGHGFGESDRDLFLAADLNASKGIATIATDVVGHGFGPRSTWNITTTTGTVSVSAHARGEDQNGDGVIASTEGVSAPLQPAADAAYSNDGGLQQTVADVMTLVRAIGHGLDVTGDGHNDLRKTGVSYYGQSFGGIYGVMLGGVDPKVKVLVLNVSGGSITEIARLSPSFRPLVEAGLVLRQPELLNGGNDNFTEDMPLRGQAPVLDPVPGAIAIQAVLADETWLDRSGDPETYAPLLRTSTAAGQFAEAGPVPERVRRSDRPQPDQLHGSRGRPPVRSRKPLPQRQDRAGEQEPARIPARPELRAGQRARAGAGRDVLRIRRADRHRPGRPGRCLGGADQRSVAAADAQLLAKCTAGLPIGRPAVRRHVASAALAGR